MHPNRLHGRAELRVSTSSIRHMLMDLLARIRGQRGLAVLTGLAIGLIAAVEFAVPQLIEYTVDTVIADGLKSRLGWVFAGFAVAALLLCLFQFVSSYLLALLGQRAVYSIRKDLYRHIQRQDVAFFDRNRTGDLLSRLTSDVNSLQRLISSDLLEMFTNVAVFIVVAIYLFFENWQLSGLLFLTFPAFYLVSRVFNRKIRAVYRLVQKSLADLTSHLQTGLSGIRLIKSFTGESYEAERFDRHNAANREANVRASCFSSMFSPLVELINAIGLAIVVVGGALFTMNGEMSTGAIFAFVAYMRLLQSPITKTAKYVRELQQGAASYDRIMEVMASEPAIRDKEGAIRLPAAQGRIEFDQVSFSYDGITPVLSELDLTIEAGKMTAVVGSSGSGKSTIAHLIHRFYDPQSGKITLDGVPIADATLASLRGQIAVVSQDVQLFGGTVRENIVYGKRDAADEEIEAAARAAGAHDFISRFPAGYSSEIGERGVMLSGGQKQRISIARALLKNPNVIVLDEATASLDALSEKYIQTSLDTLLKGRTSLVIAHRLSTIRRADRIVVLEQGRIVESGTHDELMALNGRYRELHDLSVAGRE